MVCTHVGMCTVVIIRTINQTERLRSLCFSALFGLQNNMTRYTVPGAQYDDITHYYNFN